MNIIRTVAAFAVVAGLLATPSTGLDKRVSSLDLGPSASVPAAGALANFEVKGDNLVRLLAGAFDPREDSLPTVPGIALRDAATLPGATPQYWLVQVRDRRFAEVTSAVAKAGGRVAGTVPDDTYMVRATPAQLDVIAASSAVRWGT